MAYETSSTSEALSKLWRDLVLVALSTSQDHFAVEALRGAGQLDDFKDFIRQEIEVGELRFSFLRERRG